MDNQTIPREVANWLLNSLIAVKTTQLTANTMADYTSFEKDSIVVRLGSGAVGMVVSRKLEPVTAKIVDRSADFVNAQREKYKSKKTAKKDD